MDCGTTSTSQMHQMQVGHNFGGKNSRTLTRPRVFMASYKTINSINVVLLAVKCCNSRTFKDLLHQIPKLSMPHSVFQDFSGPGKMDTFSKDLQEHSMQCCHTANSRN